MALVTKTQIKKRASAIIEKIGSLKAELEDLQTDVDMESANIEPYEGRDELTPAQEERQEWLDNISEALGNLIDGMDTDELEEHMEE